MNWCLYLTDWHKVEVFLKCQFKFSKNFNLSGHKPLYKKTRLLLAICKSTLSAQDFLRKSLTCPENTAPSPEPSLCTPGIKGRWARQIQGSHKESSSDFRKQLKQKDMKNTLILENEQQRPAACRRTCGFWGRIKKLKWSEKMKSSYKLLSNTHSISSNIKVFENDFRSKRIGSEFLIPGEKNNTCFRKREAFISLTR